MQEGDRPTSREEAPASRPTTRGTATEPGILTCEEIKDLPGQEIMDMEEGKLYLECMLLTVPGMPWMVESLSTAILQVTQYKGMTRQTTNTLRSIAFVLEQPGDDIRGDRIASRVREQLAKEGVLCYDKITSKNNCYFFLQFTHAHYLLECLIENMHWCMHAHATVWRPSR
jgi:hypothetical protein